MPKGKRSKHRSKPLQPSSSSDISVQPSFNPPDRDSRPSLAASSSSPVSTSLSSPVSKSKPSQPSPSNPLDSSKLSILDYVAMATRAIQEKQKNPPENLAPVVSNRDRKDNLRYAASTRCTKKQVQSHKQRIQNTLTGVAVNTFRTSTVTHPALPLATNKAIRQGRHIRERPKE